MVVIDMRKVLILEDNLVELQEIACELEKSYEVFKASSTAKADALLCNELDCIIIDLNITNKYLSNELRGKTHGGSLTGWVWLYNIARFNLSTNCKIVIYSEFIDELDTEIENADEDAKEYFRKIRTVSKTQAVNGSECLLEFVNSIFDSRRKRHNQ